MSRQWIYHENTPQGKIVDHSVAQRFLDDGWVDSPAKLSAGLYMCSDGTGGESFPMETQGIEEDVPEIVEHVKAEALAEENIEDIPEEITAEQPDVDEEKEDEGVKKPASGRFSDMTKKELQAYALNNLSLELKPVLKHDDMVEMIEEAEGMNGEQ